MTSRFSREEISAAAEEEAQRIQRSIEKSSTDDEKRKEEEQARHQIVVTALIELANEMGWHKNRKIEGPIEIVDEKASPLVYKFIKKTTRWSLSFNKNLEEGLSILSVYHYQEPALRFGGRSGERFPRTHFVVSPGSKEFSDLGNYQDNLVKALSVAAKEILNQAPQR